MCLKFSDLKFMSIGSNCADIGFLGRNRPRGPVDNMRGRNTHPCFQCLLEGTFLKEFTKIPKQEPKEKTFEGDTEISYIYDSYEVVHNNPLDRKFKETLEKRYQYFKDFYKNIHKPNYYFTFSLNHEILKENHSVKKSLVEEEIALLKKHNILNKTIFIGTKLIKRTGSFDFYSNDFKKMFPQVLYIELEDINLFDTTSTQEQFKNKIIDLLGIRE